MDNNNIDLTYDIKLAEQASSGSKEAFCELYGKHKDNLYRYALYKLGDPLDAEDAVSDCVLAAWSGIRQLRDPAAFGAWLYRILRNCCARKIREASRQRDGLRGIYESFPVSSDAMADSAAELKEALACLSEEDREIVLLSVIGGFTSGEISDITSLKPGSVRSRLSRSLARMREQLS